MSTLLFFLHSSIAQTTSIEVPYETYLGALISLFTIPNNVTLVKCEVKIKKASERKFWGTLTRLKDLYDAHATC